MTPPTDKPPATKSKAVQLDMTSPWQKYANVVLIPIIIGLTVFLLVRFRMNANAEARAAEMTELSDLRARLTDLQTKDIPRGLGVEQVATLRDASYSELSKRIDHLLDTSKDAIVRAETLVARGDLNWYVANFPALPGATTQPTLATPKPADTYLTAAEAAYSDVLKTYPDQTAAAMASRIGIGAIDENRGNWDQAVRDYQTIVDDKSAASAYTALAQQRLEEIKLIRQPVYIGQPSTVPALSELLDSLPTTTPAATSTTQPAPPVTTRPTAAGPHPTTQPMK